MSPTGTPTHPHPTGVPDEDRLVVGSLPHVGTGGEERWELNGLLHRLDGPALTHSDGSEVWFADDELHRENGPACSWGDGTCEWWVRGQLHRLDGPALTLPDGTAQWFIRGHRVNPDQIRALTALSNTGEHELLDLVLSLWSPGNEDDDVDALVASVRAARDGSATGVYGRESGHLVS